MTSLATYWPLLGVLVIIVGFAVRLNPVLVVVVAGLVSGFAAGKGPLELLELLGKSVIQARPLLLVTLTYPVIGVLERAGLRQQATQWILGFARLTLARLLIVYLAARQILSAVGLPTVAGHPQTVRPLLAPMAEATANRTTPLDGEARHQVRALAAATDNVGVFFGEDVFLAFGGVLLIQATYKDHGVALEPMAIALWALPTALAAFVIHSVRIAVFQLRLERRFARAQAAAASPSDRPSAPASSQDPR